MASGVLQALIFDVDGTLAETESLHLEAFNRAFAELGMDWVWTDALYLELLDVSGGKERILRHWRHIDPTVTVHNAQALQGRVNTIHALKTTIYEALVNSGRVSLRPGVLALIQEARAAGIKLAIATTTTPVNIAALLRGPLGASWRDNFAAIGDAATAELKKPHPQVYFQVLDALGLEAGQCLVIEDSSNGLRAATAAGLNTLITPNRYTAHHDFSDALRVVPDLSHVTLAQLTDWQNSGRV
jgi:beta-phosphoglucomutase-like phosphatase (HAD superfamily)